MIYFTFSKRRGKVLEEIWIGVGENTMEKAALFFDIDGTILSNDTHTIPQSAIHAMIEAQQNGHLLFINTGRTICALPRKIYAVDFDGYLCGCGCYLVYRDEVLLESHLELERGNEILEKVWECNLGVVLEGTKDVYFPEQQSRFAELERARMHLGELGLGRNLYIESKECIYDKLFLYADEKSDKEALFKYVESDMEVIDRGNDTYEVVQKKFSKATSCDFILKKFGLSKECAYVFGDSLNDLSMFEYAKHTIAMGEHAKGLEPYTEFVTKKVEEDGIAYAMKHYGLI